MVTKEEVVKKVLAELGTGKLTLADAVAKAEVLKPLKNKNKTMTWKYHFALHGVVTKDETGTFVFGRVVEVPVPVPAPAPAPVETLKVE